MSVSQPCECVHARACLQFLPSFLLPKGYRQQASAPVRCAGWRRLGARSVFRPRLNGLCSNFFSPPYLHEVLHGDGLLHVILAHLTDLSRSLASNLAPHAIHGSVPTDVSDVVTAADTHGSTTARVAHSKRVVLVTDTSHNCCRLRWWPAAGNQTDCTAAECGACCQG